MAVQMIRSRILYAKLSPQSHLQSANISSMADAIKSFCSSISSRFNGTSSSSIPHNHPIQYELDGHPIGPQPDFSLTDEIVESEQLLKDLFERWLSYHGLETDYRHDKAKRFELFKASARWAHERNKMNLGCTFGVDHMSAMTRQEIKRNCFGARSYQELPSGFLQVEEEEEEKDSE